MSIQNHTIAVVIPAYKAATTIADVVRRIPQFVDWILIIDDASPDALESEVLAISQNDYRIQYVKHESNQGVGGAMITGFRKALELHADLVAKIDADGQMAPEDLIILVNTALKYQCDYVKGNRFGHIKQLMTMPPIRRFGNILLSFMTKLASGYWNVFDPQNGYILIRRSMLRRLDLSRIDKSYFFENSMLINLNILRARIGEIYLPARYGQEISSLRLPIIIGKFPIKLLRGLVHRIYQKYVFRSVSPVFLLLAFGIPSFLFGIIWGAMAWYHSEVTQRPATAGTVLLSVLPIVLGWMCTLQALVLDVQDSGPCILVVRDDEDINPENTKSP